MAAEQNKVIVYGAWGSPYVKTVEFALRMKGIPYEYVEVDLSNKSSMLLKHNPVHKKVPVLVHNGKAICESLVIVEYIDETWKTGLQLVPDDPYKRSQIRFWNSYIHQAFEAMLVVIQTIGEVQQKAIKELFEKLNVLEDGLKGLFPDGIPSSVDEYSKNVTLLDLVILAFFGVVYEALQEVVGVNFVDPEKTPVLFSSMTALMKIPAVKDALYPYKKMVDGFKHFREECLQSATA